MLSERQKQIVEKSIELIASKGIQGFTIKNLSKSIGISEPGIYRHFESKVDILTNILNQFVEMADFLAIELSKKDICATEKIKFLFNNMVDSFSKTPALVSVVFSEEIFKNEEILNKKILEIQKKNESNIGRIIDEGQNKNEIRTDIDKNELSHIIMGSLRLMIKHWEFDNYNFNLKTKSNDIFNALNKMITIIK